MAGEKHSSNNRISHSELPYMNRNSTILMRFEWSRNKSATVSARLTSLDYKLSNFKQIRLFLLGLLGIGLILSYPVKAQLSTSEVFSSFQNKLGIADTLTEKLLSGRRSPMSGEIQ